MLFAQDTSNAANSTQIPTTYSTSQDVLDPRTTASNHDIDAVWQRAYGLNRCLVEDLADHIHPSYIAGRKQLQLTEDHFPCLEEICAVLAPAGWQVTWVPGLIRSRELARLTARRCFPVAVNVRSLEQMEHSPFPDAIHDIFGHLPFLFDEDYSDYLCAICEAIAGAPVDPDDEPLFIARLQIRALEEAQAPLLERQMARKRFDELALLRASRNSLATQLQRLFLWSIEFGVLEGPVFMGAAVLSSQREARAVLTSRANLLRYSLEVALKDIVITVTQNQHFVAKSLDHYRQVMSACLEQDSATRNIRIP